MTGRNANVFYETGYAHALGKRVILITQKAEDIPFDLKHYPHIIYEGRIADLLDDLTKKVAWALTRPKPPIVGDSIQLYIGGHLLPSDKEIPVAIESMDMGRDLQIDAHNSSETDIRTAKFKWGILFDENSDFTIHDGLLSREHFDRFKQSDNKTLFVSQKRTILRPGSWKALIMELNHNVEDGDSLTATIRLFSESGVSDTPFSIVFQEDKP